MILLLVLAAAIVRAEFLCDVPRPKNPDGLSGITRIDDAVYLSVDDSDGRMFSVQVALNGKMGAFEKVIVTNEVRLAGVVDGEGIAYDPLRKTVWVADEKGSRISEHDVRTGRRISEIKMPPHFAFARIGLGIESLAISPDGLTMWTATEEAVDGDGGKATKDSGTVVRLQRFSRASGKKPWEASGQFAYHVDPLSGEPFLRRARSGLSDLCVLEGGELIALEREFSVKGVFPTFRMRIYRVDLEGTPWAVAGGSAQPPTDLSAIEHLDGNRFVPVRKTPLLDVDTGFAMYEGLCAGPKLADGAQTLLLVSDGDDEAIESLMCVRLMRDKTK